MYVREQNLKYFYCIL